MQKETRYDYLKDALLELAYEKEPLANALIWTLDEMFPGFQQKVLENFNKSLGSRIDRLTDENADNNGLNPKDLS